MSDHPDELTSTELEQIGSLQVEIVELSKPTVPEQEPPSTENAPSSIFSNIAGLFGFGQAPALNMAAAVGSVGRTMDNHFSVKRMLGLKRNIRVNNISGRRAWVILTPAPIRTVNSVGVEKVGNIDTSLIGNFESQQCLIRNEASKVFVLDNNKTYYTIFFEDGGVWKMPFKNRKIDAKEYDTINLLERHVADSIATDFAPTY